LAWLQSTLWVVVMNGCGPHCGHHKDMIQLQQLRDLIAAVADAEQGNSEQAWSDALTALFAAVEQ
jgi:hypothetical protein